MRGIAAAAPVFLAALLAGCAFGHRFWAVQPGVDQVLRVENGDRIFFEMGEDAASGCLWDFTCDDKDVTVTIDHVRIDRADADGDSGVAKVMIRVHRGYDGPSTVTFSLKRQGESSPAKSFTITLFRRTGDAAFWR